MARETNPLQRALLRQRDTRPVYLARIDAGGQEFHSTSGRHVIDDEEYLPGGFSLDSMRNWSEASISMPATADRTDAMISGAWRNGECLISLLPAVRRPLLIQPGYVADGYFLQGDVYGDPILLLPGILVDAKPSGSRIQYRVVHHTLVSHYSPSFRLAPPVCNHLPRPGTVFERDGERFVLEARR